MPHRAVGSALSQLYRPLWTLLKPWSEPWSEGLGIMNPWVVCVSIYMYMCLYVSLCVSLTSYAYFYVSLCMFICVCFCVSMCLCVRLCCCGRCICMCDCVLERICVCLPVSMYSSGSITWADPQRERLTGPCVHSSHLRGSMVPS